MASPAMEAMQASQHVYVVKVRALPDPALLFPSERRYSALTVAGLAAGHALLGGVALLLGALALSWDPPQGPWLGHLGAGLWLGAAALQASLCGMLAWRRWYEDRYIAWFFRSSLLAAVVAGAGLVLTAAALVHLHEHVLSVQPGLPPLSVFAPEHGAALEVPEEGSGGGGGGGGASSWLHLADLTDLRSLADLPDSNSSTVSSGGVFSDLVRDQDHDHDLVAADTTRHEDRDLPEAEDTADAPSGEPEWSVLRWVPLPLPSRASAQIRSLVAANVMVACILELLWSLLGARLAWRGMHVADVDVRVDVARETAPAAHSLPHPRPTPSTATLAAMERGAADGKVDVDTDYSVDLSDAEVKKPAKAAASEKSSSRKKAKRQQQSAKSAASAASAASLQRRRRAPELPQLPLPPPPPLEQLTMNLEERVARLLDAERERSEQDDGQGKDELSSSVGSAPC